MEILAPSASLEKTKIAYFFGADAIYIGVGGLSLREHCSLDNFNELKAIISYAKSINKKVYLTINIIPSDKEIKILKKQVKELIKLKPNAFIVASFSFIKILNKLLKHTSIELHLSTQQSVINSYAIKYFKSLGIKRIVLGRELSLNEINNLNSHGLDFEVFIHGGLCMSYSGRCELSLKMSNRSANEGDCAHSCRWHYLLYGNKKLISDHNFSLSSKDLSTVEIINQIKELPNVVSLKIEGRMKSENYIATITNMYREALNNKLISLPNLNNLAGGRDLFRGNIDSLFNESSQIFEIKKTSPNQAYLAKIEYLINGRVFARVKNHFKSSEQVFIFSPGYTSKPFSFKDMRDIEGELIDYANHPEEIISFYPDQEDIKIIEGAFIKKWIS